MDDVYGVLCTICRAVVYLEAGEDMRKMDEAVTRHVREFGHSLTRSLLEENVVGGVEGVVRGSPVTARIVERWKIVEIESFR